MNTEKGVKGEKGISKQSSLFTARNRNETFLFFKEIKRIVLYLTETLPNSHHTKTPILNFGAFIWLEAAANYTAVGSYEKEKTLKLGRSERLERGGTTAIWRNHEKRKELEISLQTSDNNNGQNQECKVKNEMHLCMNKNFQNFVVCATQKAGWGGIWVVKNVKVRSYLIKRAVLKSL